MLNSFVTPLSSPVKPGTPLPVDYGTLPSMKVEITSPVKPDTLASMMAKTATPKKAEAPTPNNTVANALPLASANPLGFFNHVMAQRHLFGAPPRMTQPSDMVAQWVMNNPFMNGANANMQPNHHVGLGVDGFHHPLPASDLEPAPKQRRIDTPPGHSASFNESTMSYAMDSAMVIDLTNSDVFPRKCKRKAKKPNHKSAVDGVNVLTATVPESPPFIFTDSETAMYRGGESVECHPSPTISDSNTSTNSEVSEIQLAVQEVKAQLACIATLNNNILQLCDQDLATPNVVKYYASQIRSLCQ
uniref:Uncharacterized protein n=1 Tax=Panagrellus redivivus TaxID=6233 RepID=A0A7E4V2F8_PANRE